jgi:3-keto-5-aminohexanoate cleavage enzyme
MIYLLHYMEVRAMTDGFEPGPTVIAVAPNGGRRTKSDHPAIPLTAAELARDAAECLAAGAALIHTHVRKADGTHLLDADAYRDAIAAIRREVGDRMVVQITTESLGIYAPSEQIAVLKAVRPESASLALREFAPDAAAEPHFIELLNWMKREAVTPQIILYDPTEAKRFAALMARGDISWPAIPILFVLGRYSQGQVSRPSDLLPFIAPGMPYFDHWSVCAFGSQEAACVTAAALLGGHVRVGFENNLLLPDGRIAASNADLVRTVAAAIRDLGSVSCDASFLRAQFAS